MTPRRRLLLALGAAAFPLASFAQKKVYVIGYLSPIVPQNNTDARLETFKRGMRDLGYTEGKDYRMEVRWGEGKLERMPSLADELVKLKVDVLVGGSTPAYAAARQATKTMPIVMPTASDPVGDGFVASLARPGGNITGLSMMAPELSAKRLQLLKELLPKPARAVGVMWNPAYTGMEARFYETKAVGPTVGMEVRSIEVRDSKDLEMLSVALTRDPPAGMLLLVDPLMMSMRSRIVELARERHLPAIYETREFVDAGGLMSYGPNLLANFRRAAYYVDRILKGAKPGDLPIEQPAQLELILNLRTARALGITIPNSILQTADQVIQ